MQQNNGGKTNKGKNRHKDKEEHYTKCIGA